MVRWLPFVWASILIAATAGFGFGAAIFAVVAGGAPLGLWWPALYQAHGHLQLFGWGGLMVLGVGFFFLPRLRGTTLAAPELLGWILAFLAGGLFLRAVAQPALVGAPASVSPRAALAASGLLELMGITLAVGLLAATSRAGPPLRQRRGLLPVLPYLITAFAAAWLALAGNTAGTLLAAVQGTSAVPSIADELTVHLGLVGFLVAVSVAVSARTFPLFLWLRVPGSMPLALAFGPFLVGLALRSAGIAAGAPTAATAGQLLEGVSFVAFGVVLHVVPPRRRPGHVPSTDAHYLRPVELLLIPAYLWLVAAGLLDVLQGLAIFGLPEPIPVDAERHALASGFVTLLILGMAARMLPGFHGKQPATTSLLWATVALGNCSALLRVTPVILVGIGGTTLWPFGPPSVSLALSGLLGMGAVACLGLNLWRTLG